MNTAAHDFPALAIATHNMSDSASAPMLLAQAAVETVPRSTQPALVSGQTPASGTQAQVVASGASPGAGQVVIAGTAGFEVDVDFNQVASVNVVDTDLLLVMNDGQRIVLRDGALRAALQPDLLVRLSNQDLTTGDLFKRVGQVKPVEGGSFRLQATEIKPEPSDAADGDDVNVGESEAEAVAQEISQAVQVLERLAQAAQAASMSNDSGADGVPSPPPSPVNSNTSTARESIAQSPGSNKQGTVDPVPTSPAPDVETKEPSDKPPATSEPTPPTPVTPEGDPVKLLGPATAKMSHLELVNTGTDTPTSFVDLAPSWMLPSNPLRVALQPGQNESLHQWGGVESKQVQTRLDFTVAETTTQIVLRVETPTKLPPGFTVDGKVITPNSDGTGSFTLTVPVGSTSFKPTITWDVSNDGATFDPALFRTQATLIQTANGVSTSENKTFTLALEVITNVSQYAERDANGLTIMKMAANGYSYDITGRDTNDTLTAGNGDDILRGLAGSDNLNGGRGNDLLIGGQDADFMDGGTGVDTASYADSSQGVTVHLAFANQGLNNGGDAQGDTLLNIENLTGGDHNDMLVGDDGVNILRGGAGDDVLEGGAVADTLDGGEGTDIASYASETTGIAASLLVPANNTGAAGGDTYFSIEGLRGGEGNDLLTGDNSGNRLEGGDGDDALVGLDGDDTLIGGDGADVLIGGEGRDQLSGGEGSDTASYAQAAATDGATAGLIANLQDVGQNTGEAQGDEYDSIENLIGSAFDDRLVGDDRANTLTGGAGNDILVGGGGADNLAGGEGNDTASYDTAVALVVASLAKPDDNRGDAQGDTFYSIENLTGSDFSDTLYGNTVGNILRGGKGNDTLIGNGGGDQFDGGDNIDTVSYANVNVGVTAHLATGSQAFNSGAAAGDTYTDIENLTGSAFNDTLVGDSGRNELNGGEGDDVLDGGAGTLGDKLNGANGTDVVSYASAAASVTLNLNTGGTGGDATADEYIDIENVIGSEFDDQIEGDAQSNTLSGGAGKDVIKGGGGNDVLNGGDGDDTLSNLGAGSHSYNGGEGTDTVTYAGFETSINVNLGSTDQNSNGAGGLQFFNSIENLIGGNKDDQLFGDSSKNVLSGGAGNDTLNGAAGDDTLGGGEGDDTLIGGVGSDEHRGGEGVDVADYSNAGATDATNRIGIKVDLANTVQGQGRGSGDARGDIFSSIETVRGSAFHDTFFAQDSATYFQGGEGDDTVSYVSSSTANNVVLAVDLTNNLGLNGLAEGDTFESIENIIGSTINRNSLVGSSLNNVLSGGVANDVLDGRRGDDSLLGGAGNDVLIGGAGLDTLDGGDNTGGEESLIKTYAVATNETLTFRLAGDAVSYAYSSQAVTVNLANATAQLNADNTDADELLNIEHVIGTTADDSITGDGSANEVWGRAGNDTLAGLGGDDILEGGSGDDVLIGGEGADRLIGGIGIDTASYADALFGVVASLADSTQNIGEAEDDSYDSIENLTGSRHADTLRGNNEANVLSGAGGDDKLYGEGGSDTLLGGLGNDEIYGGGGDDTLNGGVGDDLLVGDAGADTFIGGGGFDTVSYASSSGLDSAIGVGLRIDLVNTSAVVGEGRGTGAASGDVISVDIDRIIGTALSDIFLVNANTASLTLDGGSGENVIDTVSFELLDDGVSATLRTADDSGRLDPSGTAIGHNYVSIENLTGSNGADMLEGNAAANTLAGGLGDDVLLATLGADDTLDGGVGTDIASYRNFSANIIGNLATGAVAVGAKTDTLIGIENLEGGLGDDTLTGSSASDTLSGLGGDDTLDGADGDDVLDGGEGNNTLNGGAGNDIFVGGKGRNTFNGDGGDENTVSYATVTSDITVYLDDSGENTGVAANDKFSNIQILVGGAGKDNLHGISGAETLMGGGSDDRLWGSDGADTLDGGAGIDTVDYSDSIAVTIDLSSTTQNNTGGFAEGDRLLNVETIVGSATEGDNITANDLGMTLSGQGGADTLTGGAKVDRLLGGDEDDVLSGMADNDQVFGEAGNDILYGGAGNDTMSGGDGNDILEGGDGNDTLYSGDGTDTLQGDAGDDDIYFNKTLSTENAETVFANTLEGDKAEGGSGNDSFHINASDYLDIASGVGRIKTGLTNFVIDGGADSDTLVMNFKTAEASTRFSLSQLADVNFDNIETLDMRSDQVANTVELSRLGVFNLLDDSGTTLNLNLGNGDNFNIASGEYVGFSFVGGATQIRFFDNQASANNNNNADVKAIVNVSYG